MKVTSNLAGFDISAKGMSIQRKKMNLIAENIANADTTRTPDGQPFLSVKEVQDAFANPFSNNLAIEGKQLQLNVTEGAHISSAGQMPNFNGPSKDGLECKEQVDQSQGDVVYMPDHPDADDKGYVQMSNVNIVTEMVDMIAASRSYEANLTALNSSKQMAKDSIEI